MARHELHILLEEHLTLHNVPILVLANKVDLQPHLSEIELVEALNLDYVTGCCLQFDVIQIDLATMVILFNSPSLQEIHMKVTVTVL